MNQKNHFLPDFDFDFDQTDLLVFIAGLVSVAGILIGISAFIENYVPVLILAGLATLTLVFFGFLVAIGYLSNRSQYKSAVKTLKKVQSNQVSLIDLVSETKKAAV